jgi:hypothetical protein
MTDTPSEPLSETASERVPQPTVRTSCPLVTRLAIALVVALIVTGSAFWSGYTILKGPSGWVGDRRFVQMRIGFIQEGLTEYHKKHGSYPEMLREMFNELNDKMSDEEYNYCITVYRHPAEYERTDTGWQITDYGADGKPGGIGLDADLVITSEMDENQLRREIFSAKYNATFEQVRTANDGKYFRDLLVTCLVFGGLVFALVLSVAGSVKTDHIAATIVSVVLITIAAIWIGGVITMAHTVATGH